MLALFCIEVPGIPVAKGRPRFSTRGGFARAYTPKKTGDYEKTVRDYAMDAMRGRTLLDGPLWIEIVAYLPRPVSWSRKKVAITPFPISKPDTDNFAKAAIDSLNGIVFQDDAQIVTLSAAKRFSQTPRLFISIARAA